MQVIIICLVIFFLIQFVLFQYFTFALLSALIKFLQEAKDYLEWKREG